MTNPSVRDWLEGPSSWKQARSPGCHCGWHWCSCYIQWTLHLDLEILGPFPHGVYSLNLVLWMNRRQPGPGRFRVAFTEQMLPWAVLGNEWIRQGEENTQRHGVQRGPLSSRNGEMLICENVASLGWRTGAHVGRRSPYCEDPCIYSKEFGI